MNLSRSIKGIQVSIGLLSMVYLLLPISKSGEFPPPPLTPRLKGPWGRRGTTGGGGSKMRKGGRERGNGSEALFVVSRFNLPAVECREGFTNYTQAFFDGGIVL